jgi:hypothetical protein
MPCAFNGPSAPTVKQGPDRYSYELLKRFVYAVPGGGELQMHTGGWATAFPWYATNAPTCLLPWPSVYLGVSAMIGRDAVSTDHHMSLIIDRLLICSVMCWIGLCR